MLPSTGKFKEINCPFFDSGLCERPYCHFRHVKKDTHEVLQAPATAVNPVTPKLSLGDNGEILQQLVSEAVRKVLEQTDLPSALACPSGSNAVENVSRNLATKVAEVFVPPHAASTTTEPSYNVPSPQQKVPSYKPTPISVLKNRHIPIPYSPSLTKTCTVLRKRPSSVESSFIPKKFKNQELQDSAKTSTPFSSTPKSYEPSNVSGIDQNSGVNSISDLSQYSPVGWKDTVFKYTPSAIETLLPNTYVPASSSSVDVLVAEYKPSEKSESSVEPTYEPLATSGLAIENASYEPSLVSNTEPEYQPLYCDKTTKEYVPTDIDVLATADLDISPEIDLLHDLLHEELNGSDSEDTEQKRKNSCDEVQTKHLDSGAKTLSDEKPRTDVEKPKSETGKKKLESDRKKSEDKTRTEIAKKEDSKKESESDKKKDSSKKKSSNKKEAESSNSSNKKRTESDKNKDGIKKKSESKRKSEHIETERKKSVDKKVLSEKKHSEHHHKKSETDKKKGDTVGEKKKSENETKMSESDKKKSVSGKESSNNKNTSNTHDSKRNVTSEHKHNEKKSVISEQKHNEKKSVNSEHKHSEKKSVNSENKHNEKKSVNSEHKHEKKSMNSEHKHSEKKSVNSENKRNEKKTVNSEQKNSSSSHSEPKHGSNKSGNEKKHENKKHNHHSHKKDVSGHSINSHHKEEKLSKTEEYSKLKNANSKRKYDTIDHIESKKMKSSHKDSKFNSSKEQHSVIPEEIVHGYSVSDSEASDTDFLDNVTLPSDMWADSSDEDAVTKECYRIFQEYEPRSNERKPKPTYKITPQEEDIPALGKHRVAHEGAEATKLNRPPQIRRPFAPNPSQVLSERFEKVRVSHAKAQAEAQAQAQAEAQAQAKAQAQAQALALAQAQAQALANAQASAHSHLYLGSPPSGTQRLNNIRSPVSQTMTASALPCGAKKRIAHVPNVSIMLDAKLKMQQKLKEQQQSADRNVATKAQTVQKGVNRVAHIPSEVVLARPTIKGGGGKIPTNVRQCYLDLLVEEYVKISSTKQEAYEKAEEEEKTIFVRSTTRTVYASHVSNRISRIRKGAQLNSASTSGKVDGKPLNRTVSHTSMLAGKGGSKGSWSIEKPRKPPASIVNKSLYELLAQFILNEEQLKQNGFPMTHDEEKGVAVIHNFYKKPFVPKTPSQRMCARCSKIYYVNAQGRAVKEELCVYHWGRLFQSKTRGGWEARYNCCQGHGDAIGCSVGNSHVSDNFDPNNLRGFVKTLPKENAPADGNYGVYALDCEMCYTTTGLELTRVTVIGADLSVVYETLVKPASTILDYNTRFSGIKEEDLEHITTNIYEVQSVLLSFINDKTILVGHSLESDFKALKLIHSTVVDTSVVYPHKMGPPKKRALKTLCRDLLQKIIQESDGGHDSAEDARAAMEIMLFKVKEDMKTAW